MIVVGVGDDNGIRYPEEQERCTDRGCTTFYILWDSVYQKEPNSVDGRLSTGKKERMVNVNEVQKA